MAIDHTLEIGEMKGELAKATAQKESCAREVMDESNKLCVIRQQQECQRGIVANKKMQVKILEDKIKAIKTFLRTETQFG